MPAYACSPQLLTIKLGYNIPAAINKPCCSAVLFNFTPKTFRIIEVPNIFTIGLSYSLCSIETII
jgi:hypothetical protein